VTLTVRFRRFYAKSLSVRWGDWDYDVYRVGGVDNVSIVDFDPEVPEVIRANLSRTTLLVAPVYSLSLTGSRPVSASSHSPVCDVRAGSRRAIRSNLPVWSIKLCRCSVEEC
jgi:hypothetical protein